MRRQKVGMTSFRKAGKMTGTRRKRLQRDVMGKIATKDYKTVKVTVKQKKRLETGQETNGQQILGDNSMNSKEETMDASRTKSDNKIIETITLESSPAVSDYMGCQA